LSQQQLIEQQELAAAAAAEAAVKHARHNGLVTLRYNHYKESFSIADGVLSAAAIDEKFTLSFAFPKSTLYLTAERPDSYEDFSRPLERKADANTFVDLQVGREYFGAKFFSRAIFKYTYDPVPLFIQSNSADTFFNMYLSQCSSRKTLRRPDSPPKSNANTLSALRGSAWPICLAIHCRYCFWINIRNFKFEFIFLSTLDPFLTRTNALTVSSHSTVRSLFHLSSSRNTILVIPTVGENGVLFVHRG
jgi:hypothetical protein